ncbi:MAG: phosphoribosylglycinamide formyltransferase [Chitinophagaceae bacterium]
MFEKLQQKWKVNGLQLALILCTFAIGGSLTGYTARKLMPLLGIGPNWLWILVYILLVTLIWPVAVLLISIPFGKFTFFTSYLKKIGRRMGLVKQDVPEKKDAPEEKELPVKNIAIFASGAGTNAQNIITYFNNKPETGIRVALLVSNNPLAGVLSIAEKEDIPLLVIRKENFISGDAHILYLENYGIDLIVLAGFLWKVPPLFMKKYPDKIINIHPALLPKHGGQGMYGKKVHEAVISNKETESGITIHYVDEQYDHGRVIFQATCPVAATDTAADLARKVQELEYKHYPEVIEKLLA